MAVLEKTVIDCPDPRELAAFYAAVLGMRVNEDSPDWVVIGLEPGPASSRSNGRRGGYRRPGPTRTGRGFRVYADPAGHPFCLVF